MMLQIQVHIEMPLLALGRYSGELLDEIAEAWLRGKKIPKPIKVYSIEWRTPPGPWREARDPARMNQVRKDFQAIVETDGFEFSGSAISPLG